MKLRRLRKEVAQAVYGMTDYPIGVLIGPTLSRRTPEYTHFLRVQHRTKFIEVGLMQSDIVLPVDELIEKHVRPCVQKLVAAIDPGRAA